MWEAAIECKVSESSTYVKDTSRSWEESKVSSNIEYTTEELFESVLLEEAYNQWEESTEG